MRTISLLLLLFLLLLLLMVPRSSVLFMLMLFTVAGILCFSPARSSRVENQSVM